MTSGARQLPREPEAWVAVQPTCDKINRARARVERAVMRTLELCQLWPASATVVAAVSGGADSLCLLGMLLALRERGHPLAPGEIVVAHLDHGLRGAAGAADAHFVAVLAAELGLRCVMERVDVAALARREHRSREDAARRARYAFLRRAAAEVGATRICTGHTRDDQAETVLLHLLRGSGLAGLAGMAPLASDIARPLLDVTRAQTEAFCAARGWQPRVDATNADTRYVRNRIRHDLLPLLERYNPRLRDTLARNAALIAADESYLDAQTEAVWNAVARKLAGDAVELDLEALRAQPLALRHRLYRQAARRLAGHDHGAEPEHGLEASHIEALDQLLAAGETGSCLDLPGGLRATLGYATLTFARDAEATSGQHRLTRAAEGAGEPLSVPGVVELPEAGWRVRAWLTDTAPGLESGWERDRNLTPAELLPTLECAGNHADVGRAEQRAYLDADIAGERLWVRMWRPGDRFRPLGMAHEKKLQDFFVDAKVPRDLRARLPLVFGSRHLLWVAGQRIDDRARLTAATRRVLALQLEPIEPS